LLSEATLRRSWQRQQFRFRPWRQETVQLLQSLSDDWNGPIPGPSRPLFVSTQLTRRSERALITELRFSFLIVLYPQTLCPDHQHAKEGNPDPRPGLAASSFWPGQRQASLCSYMIRAGMSLPALIQLMGHGRRLHTTAASMCWSPPKTSTLNRHVPCAVKHRPPS